MNRHKMMQGERIVKNPNPDNRQIITDDRDGGGIFGSFDEFTIDRGIDRLNALKQYESERGYFNTKIDFNTTEDGLEVRIWSDRYENDEEMETRLVKEAKESIKATEKRKRKVALKVIREEKQIQREKELLQLLKLKYEKV